MPNDRNDRRPGTPATDGGSRGQIVNRPNGEQQYRMDVLTENERASGRKHGVAHAGVGDQQYLVRVSETDEGRRVELLSPDDTETGSADVGTAPSELTVSEAGEISAPGTTARPIIERSETFAYTYDERCRSAYDGHGAVGANVEFSEAVDTYGKGAIATALCTAVGGAFSLTPGGPLAGAASQAICTTIATHVLDETGEIGSYTFGYADRDRGFFWAVEPYTSLGVTSGWDVHPDDWVSVGGHFPPGEIQGAHVNSVI